MNAGPFRSHSQGIAVAKKAPPSKKPTKKSAPAPTKKAPGAKKAPVKKPIAQKTPAAPKKKSPAPAKSKAKADAPAPKSVKSAPKATEKKPANAKVDAELAAMAASKKAAEKKIADAKAADAKKNSGRKGITIVDDKPKRRQSMTKPTRVLGPPPGVGLMGTKRKPLIASGPKAPESQHSVFNTEQEEEEKPRKKLKTPFAKKDLDKYRDILLNKRRELVGDVSTMELGVLNLGNKSGDPATDVAEQGSDAYDQSLSIGLAEVDRKLIREIDAAIKRIEEKVFGLCEISGEPISAQRLNELPWARYSIESARELERRGV